jgi:hypothetical protein
MDGGWMREEGGREERRDGWIDEWMGRGTDGWMGGWMGG